MKRILLSCLALVVLITADMVVTPESVHGQSRTGSRLGQKPATIRDDGRTRAEQARLATMEFAECVYEERRARGLAEFLDAPAYSEEASNALDSLLINNCLSAGELTVTDDLMRGAFYEVLYKKGGRLKRLDDFSMTPAVDYGTVGADNTDRVNSGIQFRQFGDCVVRSDTDAARDLVRSRLLSRAEQRAFSKVQEIAESCLLEGSRLRFSQPIMRGLVAESLYRLALAEMDRLEVAE